MSSKAGWYLPASATPEERFALQKLSREAMKARLLQDIATDLTVCMIESWDCWEYIRELQELLNSFKRQISVSNYGERRLRRGARKIPGGQGSR